MTELLAERGIQAGGIIASSDVTALRAQLGEPYEFADGEGDIAIGPQEDTNSRRFYRATDTAVLGGVLSGIAVYLNVNPLWTRLVFILVSLLSFGTSFLVYVILWIVIPPAKTAADKLRMAGKEVTVESIKLLNAQEERDTPNRVAPFIQQMFLMGFGTLSALVALGILAGVIWASIAVSWGTPNFYSYLGIEAGYSWLVWVLFWVTMFGLLLLSTLFSIIAYGFFAKKVTKGMVISGAIVIVLGIVSAAAVIGVASSQAIRIEGETRSMVETSRAQLSPEFTNVSSLNVVVRHTGAATQDGGQYIPYTNVRYIVDPGKPRYELKALNTARFTMTTNGSSATATLEVPANFRNRYVQPELVIYGPSLNRLSGGVDSNGVSIDYTGNNQAAMELSGTERSIISARGAFTSMTVTGAGSVDVSSASVNTLTVNSEDRLSVSAGVVRELIVTQPDVCAIEKINDGSTVSVIDVSSGSMMYNGKALPAKTYRTSCGSVEFQPKTYQSEEY